MRIAKLIFALTFGACGCASAPEPVVKVEHAVVKNEQQLERVRDSYDSSEQDIGRMRLSVFELVHRGRFVSEQLEMAAREFQMAAVYNHLASKGFIRAAASYQRAAETYRQVASLIIMLASSGRFLSALCKRPTSLDEYRSMLRVFDVEIDEQSVEQLIPRILGEPNGELAAPDQTSLELPLPVMDVLVKRAARMLLCIQ